jgi:hypothetical protein
MRWGKVLKKVVTVGKVSLPIAAAFGVPGASTVQMAVGMIHDDPKQDDKQAVKLVGAAVDDLDERLDKVEAFIEGLKAGKKEAP